MLPKEREIKIRIRKERANVYQSISSKETDFSS